MKKMIKIVLVTTVLIVTFAATAFASNFDHCADALSELGLFRGTQNGYELDREPTRAEAATMLVRLLGAEKEALALSYTAPYTDVADWAKPYVQYLHDKGLTKGTSAVTFGYSDKCTAQQYTTFLLRALGYTDGENADFAYTDALAFAEKCGVADFVNCAGNTFLRDNVAAMSYTALSAAPKSGEADLLTKLKAAGVVSDDKGYIAVFENYREYAKAASAMNEATKLSSALKMSMEMTSTATDTENVKIDYNLAFAVDVDTENPDKSERIYQGTIKTATELGKEKNNVEMPVSYYFADGYLYIDVSGQKQKEKVSYSEALAKMDINLDACANPISLIKDIKVQKTADGDKTYSVVCAPGGINAAGDALGDVKYTSFVLSLKIRSEKLVSVSGDIKMEVPQENEKAEVSVKYEMTDIKIGADVKINPPKNLNEYK